MTACRMGVLLLTIFAMTTAASGAEVSFKAPFGVAVNSNDVIYVAEIANKRISKLSVDGKYLGEISTIEGYGALVGPFDVCIGPEDRIYITDCFGHRVIVLDAEEKLQFILGDGTKGSKPGQLAEPHFITVNQQGEIFVADTFNARIQKFSAKGEFLTAWGRVGENPGEYLHNGYLARLDVDGKGFIYVREFDGGRIQKYTENGNYVATFSGRGVNPGELDEGYGLSVIDGKLYCPDTFESRIQVFSLDGELLEVWDPGEGNSGSFFNHPVDIAETTTGDLIVTDWKNDRVIKLNKKGEFLDTWGGSMGDLLAWKPPVWYERPNAHEPVKVSIYAGPDSRTLELSEKYGISILYWSFDNQYKPWNHKAVIELAASKGVEVHPSIACLNFGQGGVHGNSPIFNEHPEWCLWKKGATEPMGTILSWGHPETRSFRASHLAEQIKTNNVPGLMLDYIRYLGTDYGYDPIIVNGFFKKYHVNPLTLPQDDQRWMQYRADFVTDFIAELRHKLATQIPHRNIEISAYLSGDDPAPDVYLKGSMQDWRTWAKMGLVDKLHVAWYTRDLDQIYNAVRRVREAVPDRVKINSFIACYGGNLNTPELLRKGFEASIAGGADEVTIYRIDAIYELDMFPAIGQIAKDIREGKFQ